MCHPDRLPTRARSTARRAKLTLHALQRWQQRVESNADAHAALSEFVAGAHRRSRPRHWTVVDPAPGLSFLYWARRPDICALVLNDTVVTVLARSRHLRDLRLDDQLSGARAALALDSWPAAA